MADLGFSSFSSINLDRAERLDCQVSDNPSRPAIIPLKQRAQSSCTITRGFFSNPAAASPRSDYGPGHATISYLHGIGGFGKTTIARDFVASLQRDERHKSYFWITAEDRENPFGLGCLKRTLGSVAFQVRPPGGSKMGNPAVDMEESISRRYDIWSLAAMLPLIFVELREECMYERASISRLTACVHCPDVLYGYEKGARHNADTFAEARDLSFTEGSGRNRGDQGIGPHAGKPGLGREDDDDDDCVGFRRLSDLKHRKGTLQGNRRSFRGQADKGKYRAGNVHPGQPRYGPPYLGLVDMKPRKVVVNLPSASMVGIWREAIARTCGQRKMSNPPPLAWESAGKEGDGNNSICMGARGGGNRILCAH